MGQCLGMLVRAQRLGIPVNMVMMNTAMSALAKARRTSEAVALFGSIPQPNAVRPSAPSSHIIAHVANSLDFIQHFSARSGSIASAVYAFSEAQRSRRLVTCST